MCLDFVIDLLIENIFVYKKTKKTSVNLEKAGNTAKSGSAEGAKPPVFFDPVSKYPGGPVSRSGTDPDLDLVH